MKPRYRINLVSKINTTKNKIIMKTMIEVDWKMIFIPALLVLQIIIITTALKNRYKKE